MRKLIPLLLALAAIAAGAFLCLRHTGCTEDDARELTINLLRTIPKAFLILETDEQVALPVIDNGDWLLGPRRGQASIRLRSHWGCDLQSLSPADMEVSGSHVRIRLPAPALFDTAADLASWDFNGKRSGLQCIGDLAMGRSLESELLRIVHRAAPERSPGAAESRRAAFVHRLNREAAGLFRAKGLEVEFY